MNAVGCLKNLRQQLKPDTAQKHVYVVDGAAALLELGLFYWKNVRSANLKEVVLHCGSAIFIFKLFQNNPVDKFLTKLQLSTD